MHISNAHSHFCLSSYWMILRWKNFPCRWPQSDHTPGWLMMVASQDLCKAMETIQAVSLKSQMDFQRVFGDLPSSLDRKFCSAANKQPVAGSEPNLLLLQSGTLSGARPRWHRDLLKPFRSWSARNNTWSTSGGSLITNLTELMYLPMSSLHMTIREAKCAYCMRHLLSSSPAGKETIP